MENYNGVPTQEKTEQTREEKIEEFYSTLLDFQQKLQEEIHQNIFDAESSIEELQEIISSGPLDLKSLVTASTLQNLVDIFILKSQEALHKEREKMENAKIEMILENLRKMMK